MFNIHNKNFLLLVNCHYQGEQLQFELDMIERMLRPFLPTEAMLPFVEIANLNSSQLLTKGPKLKKALMHYCCNKAFVFLIGKN